MGDYETTIIAQQVTKLIIEFCRMNADLDQEWDWMWYCNLIVTDPGHQNRGHATFLMNEFFARVRERT